MPAAVAPIAIPAVGLLAIMVALSLLALYAAHTQMFRPLLEAMADHVPVVGRYIRRGIARVDDAAGAVWERLLDPMVDNIVDWLDALAIRARGFGGDVADFATSLAADVDWLVTHRIPDEIASRLAPVRELAGDAKALAARADARIDAFRVRVLDVELPRVYRGIDALRDRFLEVELPRLARGIDRLEGRADAIAARVRDVAGDLAGVRSVDLPNLRVDVGDLRRLWERVDTYVGPIAAVFTAGAVVELLRHVRACRPKTERLCRIDDDYLAELLETAVVLASLPLIIATVRSTAHALGDREDEIRRLLRSTLT